MKLLFCTLFSFCLISCLKDIEPLDRDNYFDPVNIKGPWVKLHSTSKEPLWNGGYYPVLTYEIIDEYLLSLNYSIGVKVGNIGRTVNYPATLNEVGDKLYFTFTIANLQQQIETNCFSLSFYLNDKKNEVGDFKICVDV